MELYEVIKKRHSYRGEFTDTPVSRETLKRIVEAGIRAPSGCNAQTTSFVIVDDPNLLEQLREIMTQPVVKTAKAVIVCVAEHRAVFEDMAFGVEDCSAAVENILLAITAEGLASVWIDGGLRRENRAQRIAELLAISSHLDVRIFLPIGEPRQGGEQPARKPFEARAAFNRFPTTE